MTSAFSTPKNSSPQLGRSGFVVPVVSLTPLDAWHLSPNRIMITIRVGFGEVREASQNPREIVPAVLDDWRGIMRKAMKPVTMLCTCRSKKGKEKERLALAKRHWRTLNRAGLVTKEPAVGWRALVSSVQRMANALSYNEALTKRGEESEKQQS